MHPTIKPSPQERSSEDLLLSIRNLLVGKASDSPPPLVTPEGIERMISDGLRQSRLIGKESVKPHVQNKIEEMSNILEHQNQEGFVQQYAKQKIYSEIFGSIRRQIPEKERRQYQKQRQELLRQRQNEQHEDKQRQRRVIEATKKFARGETKSLPYSQINQFRQKEGQISRSYLLNQPAENNRLSTNNKLDNSSEVSLRQRSKELKRSSKSPRKAKKDEVIQVVEVVDQDDTMNEDFHKVEKEKALYQTLKNSPNFVAVFKQILLNQMDILRFASQEVSGANKNRSSLTRAGHKYQNKALFVKQKKETKLESVASLSKKYKSKGVVIKELASRSLIKETKVICRKVVSKMNGVGPQFHPRRVILSQNQVVWLPEEQKVTADSKRMDLLIQYIECERKSKTEGTFFSKMDSNVQIVVLKGKNRELMFERDYLEGYDLYQELCCLMAGKVYSLNVILSCKVNAHLENFVHSKKAHCFSLANVVLQPHQKYQNKDYRLMIIKILSALFPFRKEVNYLDLNCCQLNTIELNSLLGAIGPLKHLHRITISETKFSPDTLILLSKHIALLTSEKIELTMSSCMIDDNILEKGKESFLKCTKIHKLNISLNDFNLAGFETIRDYCAQDGQIITELNINGCRIMNLTALGDLVRRSKTLQVLFAQQCGFSFDNQAQMGEFFQNCRKAKLKRLSLLGNDVVNNLKTFEEFWAAESPKVINLDLGVFNEKTSRHLQGRLL